MASYDDIKKTLKYPDGVSDRFKELDARDRILDGSFYDEMTYPFDKERTQSGKYIPLEERRPSLVYGLARIIADECSSLTFGEGHSPHVRCWDQEGDKNPFENTEKAIEKISEAAELDSVMMRGVFRGSIGSAALVVRALESGLPHISVVRGKYVWPSFDINDPTLLVGLLQQFPVRGSELLQRGYPEAIVENENEYYWLRSTLDDKRETWYNPLPNDKFQRLKDKNTTPRVRWTIDKDRSNDHRFGLVPAVWLRNGTGDEYIDGPATFGPVIHLIIKIDYLLSQIARGVRFSADPLLVIKRGELLSLRDADSPLGGAEIVKDPSAGIELEGADSDAKMLEMTGKGIDASREYIALLREYALEVVGGMRSSADQSNGGPQSGRALEILHQALVWLVERMRLAYGNRGLVPLLRIIMQGIKRGALEFPDVKATDINLDAPVRLVWPSWWKPRGADLLAEVNAIETLVGGSPTNPEAVITRETGTRFAAMALGISDPNKLVDEMETQRTEDETKADEQADKDHQRQVDSAVAVAKAKSQATGAD